MLCFNSIHIHVSGISVNAPAHKSTQLHFVVLYLLKFIFAKRGGGWTTTHLYVHRTFVMTMQTYETTPYIIHTYIIDTVNCVCYLYRCNSTETIKVQEKG